MEVEIVGGQDDTLHPLPPPPPPRPIQRESLRAEGVHGDGPAPSREEVGPREVVGGKGRRCVNRAPVELKAVQSHRHCTVAVTAVAMAMAVAIAVSAP
eukprot:CAMPEP_0182922026 /NCGR_PEP_ID=MMETSP0105_2-20130417/4529_1 /TAXON_ID=81532 ORGANISM="Acanthoeca-like sp., Strain 10tr" /NCGR_SAMPLE_ID=MMETSP0105_2 /ASSEMBLY_ACC=CAM_ASM_000205 /LENGTH=97 /DNA_ID=CAMNT_0025059611 /DNA_START=565 /DNA_END=858 /DNA_ORIENTATION=+